MKRGNLKIRLGHVSEQGKEDDLRATSPGERLAMVWPLTLNAWVFKGEPGAEPRLQRHIIRLQRRES